MPVFNYNVKELETFRFNDSNFAELKIGTY